MLSSNYLPNFPNPFSFTVGLYFFWPTNPTLSQKLALEGKLKEMWFRNNRAAETVSCDQGLDQILSDGPLINSFIHANEMHVPITEYGGNAATWILTW